MYLFRLQAYCMLGMQAIAFGICLSLQDFIASLGLSGVALTRTEWGLLRGALGRPRRLSLSFLKQERTRLEGYRVRVRMVGRAQVALYVYSVYVCNHMLHDPVS